MLAAVREPAIVTDRKPLSNQPKTLLGCASTRLWQRMRPATVAMMRSPACVAHMCRVVPVEDDFTDWQGPVTAVVPLRDSRGPPSGQSATPYRGRFPAPVTTAATNACVSLRVPRAPQVYFGGNNAERSFNDVTVLDTSTSTKAKALRAHCRVPPLVPCLHSRFPRGCHLKLQRRGRGSRPSSLVEHQRPARATWLSL